MNTFKLNEEQVAGLKSLLLLGIDDGGDMLTLNIDNRDRKAWNALLLDIAITARAAGAVSACTNAKNHGRTDLRLWNSFVKDGPDALRYFEVPRMLDMFVSHVQQTIYNWMLDPSGESRKAYPKESALAARLLSQNDGIALPPRLQVLRSDDVSALTLLLVAELENPQTDRHMLPLDRWDSTYDGRALSVILDGWAPQVSVWDRKARCLVAIAPVSERPPIRHIELAVPSGQLVAFSTTDTMPTLSRFLHEDWRSGKKARPAGERHKYGTDPGANAMSLEAYGRHGVFTIPLGDHFPHLVQDGSLLRGRTVMDEAEGDLTGSALDDPGFVDLEDLKAILRGQGVEDIDAAIAEEIKAGSFFMIEVPSNLIHLYAPDGWRAAKFADTIKTTEHGIQSDEDAEYYLMSESPLDFPKDLVAEVEMPVRVTEPEQDSPEP